MEERARSFAEVLAAELCEIELSRKARTPAGQAPRPVVKEGDPYRAAANSQLVGLAFSGGGIRSATFNLGVLQALARLGLLAKFDYLSTVSGGGYIGSWLSAWIHHEQGKEAQEAKDKKREAQTGTGLKEVAGRLDPERAEQTQKTEPPQINFLRQYSNYLTPRRGLFGADTWTVIGIYFRNFFINLTIIVLAALALLLVPRLQALYFIEVANASSYAWSAVPVVVLVSVAMLALAFAFVVANLSNMFGGSGGDSSHMYFAGSNWTQLLVILPILLSAWFLSAWLWAQRVAVVEHWGKWSLYVGVVYLGLWFLGCLLGEVSKPVLGPRASSRLGEEHLQPDVSERQTKGVLRKRLAELRAALQVARARSEPVVRRVKGVGSRALTWDFAKVLITAGISGVVAGLLLAVLASLLCTWTATQRTVPVCHIANWAFFLVLGVFFVAETLHIALAGSGFSDDAREWWGRLGGILLLWSLLLAGLFALVLDGPWWLDKLGKFAAAQGWLKPSLLLGWLATSVSSVLAGRSPSSGSAESKPGLEFLGTIGPPVFVVGLLLILSSIVQSTLPDVMAKLPGTPPPAVERNTAPALPCPSREVTPQTQNGPPCSSRSRLTAIPMGAENFPGFPASDAGAADEGKSSWEQDRLYWARMQDTFNGWLWVFFFVFLLLAWGLSRRVGINEFCMHMLYRNRLVRCYLGAARSLERKPHPFTGFDPLDDRLPLATLRPSVGYPGPYLIINTALNLVKGRKLAWQQRKATSFVFSPLYSGYEVDPESRKEGDQKPSANPPTDLAKLLVLLGLKNVLQRVLAQDLARNAYRDTEAYAESISVGTAMAISGAAASPNMGYHSSPALAFLMTVFNVRLGCWVGNPRHNEAWKDWEPRRGLLYLVKELLGSTDDRQPYIYLSDGGHFENLGIYELVRRRCRFILACDAEEDHEMKFGGLGGAVEKCRADFGIEIEIDVESLQRREGSDLSQVHCAIGRIRYEKTDQSTEEGILVYLKSSMVKDDNEPVDIQVYKALHSEFPHESTADQWFDESQFESYRALGHHIASVVFEKAGNKEELPKMDPERLFTILQERWTESHGSSEQAS